jgi:hypothetical protein
MSSQEGNQTVEKSLYLRGFRDVFLVQWKTLLDITTRAKISTCAIKNAPLEVRLIDDDFVRLLKYLCINNRVLRNPVLFEKTPVSPRLNT